MEQTHIPGVTLDGEEIYGAGQQLGSIKSFAGTWFYTLPGYQGGVVVSSRREGIDFVARRFVAQSRAVKRA